MKPRACTFLIVTVSLVAGQHAAVARQGKSDVVTGAQSFPAGGRDQRTKVFLQMFPREQQAELMQTTKPLFELMQHPHGTGNTAALDAKDLARIKALFDPLPAGEQRTAVTNFGGILKNAPGGTREKALGSAEQMHALWHKTHPHATPEEHRQFHEALSNWLGDVRPDAGVGDLGSLGGKAGAGR